MTNKSRAIAINGILIALMLVMCVTMLFTGGIALLPLTVLVVGMVVIGKWTGFILGLTFGLVSFITAFIFPSPTAPFFQNPLVSLLPRLLSVAIAYGVYWLSNLLLKKVDKKLKKPMNSYLKKGISTALGAIFVVFLNTLLVLSMIWILYNGKNVNGTEVTKAFVMGLITINFTIEIIVTPLLSVPIAFAVDKFLTRNKKQVVTNEDLIELDGKIDESANFNDKMIVDTTAFESISQKEFEAKGADISNQMNFAKQSEMAIENELTENRNYDNNANNTDFQSENLKNN